MINNTTYISPRIAYFGVSFMVRLVMVCSLELSKEHQWRGAMDEMVSIELNQ